MQGLVLDDGGITLPSGTIHWISPQVNLRSTEITGLTFDGNAATITGSALLNNRSGHTFVARVVDGQPDSLAIQIYDPAGTPLLPGSFVENNPLVRGDLQILQSEESR